MRLFTSLSTIIIIILYYSILLYTILKSVIVLKVLPENLMVFGIICVGFVES